MMVTDNELYYCIPIPLYKEKKVAWYDFFFLFLNGPFIFTVIAANIKKKTII
jgi:hypothetical protein